MGYFIRALYWKKSQPRWKVQFISYKKNDIQNSQAKKPKKDWDIESEVPTFVQDLHLREALFKEHGKRVLTFTYPMIKAWKGAKSEQMDKYFKFQNQDVHKLSGVMLNLFGEIEGAQIPTYENLFATFISTTFSQMGAWAQEFMSEKEQKDLLTIF